MDGYVLQSFLQLPLSIFPLPPLSNIQRHPLHGDAAPPPLDFDFGTVWSRLWRWPTQKHTQTYFFRGKMDNGKANELACSETVPIGTRHTHTHAHKKHMGGTEGGPETHNEPNRPGRPIPIVRVLREGMIIPPPPPPPPRDREPIVAGWTSRRLIDCLGLFFVCTSFFLGLLRRCRFSWGFWLVGKRGWCGCEKVLSAVALCACTFRETLGLGIDPLLCSFLSFGLVAWVLGLGFPSFASLFISPFTSHTFTSAYTPRLER